MTAFIIGVILVMFLIILTLTKWLDEEKSKRKLAEQKVKAHEALQRIDEEIDNGGDVYLADQLRELQRDL
jgi:biopolymer transport protein ExbD